MSVTQLREVRARSIDPAWPQNEPLGEPAPTVRTAFDVMLDVCRGLEDPEFHDGWQPVRARSDARGSE
jgi:hypothetical protein